jgi:glycine/D-amino acid oxidase-like deaminating enzyme
MNALPDSPVSLWQDQEHGQPAPALQDSRRYDVVVIGGGFTGLTTAYEIKRAEPALRVGLLEARRAGYGASGRNGSFGMTVVGLGFGVTAQLRGKTFLKDAHRYMERAVEAMDDLILREKLDCARLRPGFLRVATTRAYIRKLQDEVELMQGLGFQGIHWMDQEEVHKRVRSERYLGGMFEDRLVLVDPMRLVSEEKHLAMKTGVEIFENSPVVEVSEKSPYTLRTPSGAVQAEKIVYAVNAYSHLFGSLRRKQYPAFTYVIATEPLTSEQLAPINWSGFEGVEDARNLIHYYRLTTDGRIVMGGGPVGLKSGGNLDADTSPQAWAHLERHIHFLFPHLKGVRISHRWGGPFSVTMNLTPCLGYVKDRSSVYSLGCIGHGVSMSHLNAQTLRDLVLECQSDLIDGPFTNKRSLSWPPEPLSSLAAKALRAFLDIEDRYHERSLPRH